MWVGCKGKEIKMATELELAEEMSNSSPERAMELLSSIGEPQSRMLNVIFTFIFQCYIFECFCSEWKVNWGFLHVFFQSKT